MDSTVVFIANDNQDSYWDIFFRILPIITLILGALVTLILQKLNEIILRRRTKNFLIHSIQSLIESSKKQSENLGNLVAEFKKKTNEVPMLSIDPGFHVVNLDIIDKHQLFLIFVNKWFKNKQKRSEFLTKYIDTIEVVKTIIQHEKDEINRLRDVDFNSKGNFNTLYGKLRETINHKNERINNTISSAVLEADPNIVVRIERDKKLIAEVNKLYSQFYNNPDEKNAFKFYGELIMPLYELAKKFNDHEFAIVLPPLIEECETYIGTRESFAKRFEFFNAILNKSIKNLVEIKDFLN